jgi:plastocyanin
MIKLLATVLAMVIIQQILIFIPLIPIFSNQLSFGFSVKARQDKTINEIIIPFAASYHQLQKDNYLPNSAVVKYGSIVTWVNQDILDHTVTADDGSFDIQILHPGSSGTSIIDAIGNITYHCNIHPWMKAVLQSEMTN